ncbi:MAG: hypothetical protein OJF59_002496 [Cytophagales bacterium]|jgi:hypothetical protein|nr:hypothetical protein [Bacteroidota bacterium]MBS1980223.1 hypothetical protein [Bacteroidota bacterium]WHZ08742.1 MAG: hypothetical protein OJF59_002496 [Cytophagales bacterium]
MIAKANKDFRVQPIIDRQQKDGRGYVNIRVASRKNERPPVDVSVYLNDKNVALTGGERRFKLRKNQLVDQKVHSGFSPVVIDSLNDQLDEMTTKLVRYTETNKVFNKESLESVIYGDQFLTAHKSRRTKEVAVRERLETELLTNLRKRYPVRNGIDPLDLDHDFPASFPKLVFDQVARKFQTQAKEEGRIIHPINLQQLVWLELNHLFYDHRVKKLERIDTEVINDYERNHKPVYKPLNLPGIPIKLEVAESKYSKDEHLLLLQEKANRRKMSTAELFEKQLFNKENIFECFIAARFKLADGTQVADKPAAIVWRLLQYRDEIGPSSLVKEFNEEWCKAFFNYLFKEGYYKKSFKGIDPMQYRPKDMWTGEKYYYDSSMKESTVKNFKRLVTSLSSKKVGLLPKIDWDELTRDKVMTKTEIMNIDPIPQDEQILEKPEIDFLFKYGCKNPDLEIWKDRFLLLIMFGGLRINEFNSKNLELRTDGHGEQYVNFKTSKQSVWKEVSNPLNAYSSAILGKYDGQIPFFGEPTKTKHETYQLRKTDQNLFNQKLRELIVETGRFKRKVKDKQINDESKRLEVGSHPIEEIISSLFARHSFSSMLRKCGVSVDDIPLFTGHSLGGGAGRGEVKRYLISQYKDYTYKRQKWEERNIKPE